MAKSLPRCLEGDFNKRSTFSKNKILGLFFLTIDEISHHKTPFLPSMPLLLVAATE
jgi:hypothetical protein